MAKKRYRGRTRRMAHRLCWAALIGTVLVLMGMCADIIVEAVWAMAGHGWGRALLAALGLAVVGAVGLREG